MSGVNHKLDIEGDFHEFLSKSKGIVQGEQPHDLAQQCLKYCQQFLDGSSSKLSVKDIEIKRLTSGMSNQTYQCIIRKNSAHNDKERQEVVIRLYGLFVRMNFKTLELTEDKMDEGIVALMASEIGIGPKIYGLFKTGQIMKYYSVNI